MINLKSTTKTQKKDIFKVKPDFNSKMLNTIKGGTMRDENLHRPPSVSVNGGGN